MSVNEINKRVKKLAKRQNLIFYLWLTNLILFGDKFFLIYFTHENDKLQSLIISLSTKELL